MKRLSHGGGTLIVNAGRALYNNYSENTIYAPTDCKCMEKDFIRIS